MELTNENKAAATVNGSPANGSRKALGGTNEHDSMQRKQKTYLEEERRGSAKKRGDKFRTLVSPGGPKHVVQCQIPIPIGGIQRDGIASFEWK